MIQDTNKEIIMRCNIRGCMKKARWIVDDNGVDTNLCPEHLDEYKDFKKQIQEEIDRVKMKQHGSM